jgi:rhodanese-related sulfurtransferase
MIPFLSRLFRPRALQPTWLDAAELRRRLAAGEAPLLVDVRNPDEFTGPLGHLPGAVNVPLPELAARAGELAGGGRPIVLVCRTDRRSAQAAAALAARGARDVAVLRGGMEEWRRQNPSPPATA